ncbi:MAG: hypothetical protein A2284_03890 [Deltaproteobacteria bacterium RIFOXYA12_FULL_61_11]|nr:MAG: hypothetical protein A2284_03890 [Deltaproteobacteria bacterium RIFOXYA12_FULL_61_11]
MSERKEPKDLAATKWWGWGHPAVRYELARKPRALAFLAQRLGMREYRPLPPPDPAQVTLPASTLGHPALTAFRRLLGEERCRNDHAERLCHARGKSYPDLLALRGGTLAEAPDLVLYPREEGEVESLLELCERHDVAVVPYGGGTSVVGGVHPARGARGHVACLDLRLCDRLLALDPLSHTATFEAGILGPSLEQWLGQVGFTLGHFPQSFEYSTLGGWVATRSAGQHSLGYGRIEDLVVALGLTAPGGKITTPLAPARSCGPDLGGLVLGSEGTLGVITNVTLRLTPLPAEQRYLAWLFHSFDEAVAAAREVVQAGIHLAMLRVSDEPETEVMFELGGDGGTLSRRLYLSVGRGILALHRFTPGTSSMVLVGLEGSREEAGSAEAAVSRCFSRHAGFCLGASPGRSWAAERFHLPYLRDELLDQHLLVDTFETATTWSNLDRLYRGVRLAVETWFDRQGQGGLVTCHVSHLYRTGASLYFSVMTRQQDNPLAQWGEFKQTVSQAVVERGGVISHHHGIGLDHKPYLHLQPAERGVLGAVKRTLDPDGLMNPGKLLPTEEVAS